MGKVQAQTRAVAAVEANRQREERERARAEEKRRASEAAQRQHEANMRCARTLKVDPMHDCCGHVPLPLRPSHPYMHRQLGVRNVEAGLIRGRGGGYEVLQCPAWSLLKPSKRFLRATQSSAILCKPFSTLYTNPHVPPAVQRQTQGRPGSARLYETHGKP